MNERAPASTAQTPIAKTATKPYTRHGQIRDRIGARHGRNIGVVAAARELITLVFYGLRDHHIRCLAPARPSTPAA